MKERLTLMDMRRWTGYWDPEAEFVRAAAKATLERSEWDGCPHCAERRAKKAEAIRRYRAKKKEQG